MIERNMFRNSSWFYHEIYHCQRCSLSSAYGSSSVPFAIILQYRFSVPLSLRSGFCFLTLWSSEWSYCIFSGWDVIVFIRFPLRGFLTLWTLCSSNLVSAQLFSAAAVGLILKKYSSRDCNWLFGGRCFCRSQQSH